jgi:hypothetical protein
MLAKIDATGKQGPAASLEAMSMSRLAKGQFFGLQRRQRRLWRSAVPALEPPELQPRTGCGG